jgi:uncharacterized repeat protein (TIGR03803 family)
MTKTKQPAGLWLAWAIAAVSTVPLHAQTATETVLHNFASPPKGAFPYAGVINDSAGNLYGTANSGGPANAGVVYKIDTAGRQTVLYSFTGGSDGGNPYGGVVRDAAGNLYGTTVYGGAASSGVVFKIDPSGHETVLYTFSGGADGAYPYAGVIRDSAGNLYGTTCYGGSVGYGYGVVFKLDATGHLTVLHSFPSTDGDTPDGENPYAGVIRDSAGNLYGTTFSGGSGGFGVVYSLDPSGHETVLYSFKGWSDGGYPYAGVIRDSAGNLYGTTYTGANGGVVYKLDTTGNETVLYTFMGGADGGYPYAGVIRDSSGNLYGTTQQGGAGNLGVIYSLNPAGQETVLYTFTGAADGAAPYAGVIRDAAGNLYGTTLQGGIGNIGAVYKLDPAGHETASPSFPNAPGGTNPYAGVIRDSAGNLYGTTTGGGPANAGVVYKLSPAGQETVLYSFTGGADGRNPYAGVTRDSAGNLYGTTLSGGTGKWGVVYELDPAGHETVLHSFTLGADGGLPYAGVIRDSAGNLYGTTTAGGYEPVWGVVYKLDPTGKETVLHSFGCGAFDGCVPYAGVILDAAGNLYGTTHQGGTGRGVVYKLDMTGAETALYTFTGEADGGNPYAGVIRDSAGNLYGTTYTGAANGGVIYKLDTAGNETELYTFTGATSGFSPNAGVIGDSAGNFYGTTLYGGTGGWGVVYKLDPSGNYSVLYNFTGGADGGTPYAGLIRDSAGNLYGTTYYGGKSGTGVVFKLKPQ